MTHILVEVGLFILFFVSVIGAILLLAYLMITVFSGEYHLIDDRKAPMPVRVFIGSMFVVIILLVLSYLGH